MGRRFRAEMQDRSSVWEEEGQLDPRPRWNVPGIVCFVKLFFSVFVFVTTVLDKIGTD
jgi:hypothetical protein